MLLPRGVVLFSLSSTALIEATTELRQSFVRLLILLFAPEAMRFKHSSERSLVTLVTPKQSDFAALSLPKINFGAPVSGPSPFGIEPKRNDRGSKRGEDGSGRGGTGFAGAAEAGGGAGGLKDEDVAEGVLTAANLKTDLFLWLEAAMGCYAKSSVVKPQEPAASAAAAAQGQGGAGAGAGAVAGAQIQPSSPARETGARFAPEAPFDGKECYLEFERNGDGRPVPSASSGNGTVMNAVQRNDTYWESNGTRPHWVELPLPSFDAWETVEIEIKNHGLSPAPHLSFLFASRFSAPPFFSLSSPLLFSFIDTGSHPLSRRRLRSPGDESYTHQQRLHGLQHLRAADPGDRWGP